MGPGISPTRDSATTGRRLRKGGDAGQAAHGAAVGGGAGSRSSRRRATTDIVQGTDLKTGKA
jgi:hypothetical protein